MDGLTHVLELETGDPERVGGYRPVGRLGAGGQGVVYLAEDEQGALFAVKILRADHDAARERFVAEAAHARQVPRFCTAAVLAADFEAHLPYVVSEYVVGPTLQRLVERRGPRAGADLERLAVATATALMAVHNTGLVHLDFKPANIIIGEDGPRVIDFGIARLTATITSGAVRVGTPAYMAPEQAASGAPIGPPADMWAWAMTMAFAASGHKVVLGEYVEEVLARVVAHDFVLTAMEEPMAGLVGRCVCADPAGRPTAREVLAGLTGLPDTLTDDQILQEGANRATTSAHHGPGDYAALAERSLADGALALAIRYARDGLAAPHHSAELGLDHARCYHALGEARERSGQNGLHELQLAYEINPADPGIVLDYGRALVRADKAAYAYQIALHDEVVISAYVDAIIEKVQQGTADPDDIHRALRLRPDHQMGPLLLANLGPSGIREAFRRTPDDPAIVEAYTELLLAAQKHRQTLRHLRSIGPSLTARTLEPLCQHVVSGLYNLQTRDRSPAPIVRLLIHDTADALLSLPVHTHRWRLRRFRLSAYGGLTAYFGCLAALLLGGLPVLALPPLLLLAAIHGSGANVSDTEFAVVAVAVFSSLLWLPPLIVTLTVRRRRREGERELDRQAAENPARGNGRPSL